MKKNKHVYLYAILMGIFLFISSFISAQSGKEVIKQMRQLPEFQEIDAGGIFDIYLQQGEEQSVEIETEEKYQDKVITKVENEILHISSKSIINPNKLNVYITVKKLDRIEISGTAEIKGQNIFKSASLKIIASGASRIKLEVEADKLYTNVSGAADIIISGNAREHHADASGAGKIDASELNTEDTYANASGAGVISAGDTTKVKVGGLNIEVIENDSTIITIGKHIITVDENGNVDFRKSAKKRFNGHWGGFELGINGYLTPDFNMIFPKEFEYMDLRMEKSIGVYFNLLEQNFTISRNKKFGIVTGLGIESHNYRFLHSTTLVSDSSVLVGYLDRGVQVRKSKLVVNYFSLPIIFEWQTNQFCKKNSFHIAGGVILGVRFSSHTKKYFDEQNKEYYLTKYDPNTSQYVDEWKLKSSDQSIAKDPDDFHLNPFKVDATFRIGWGFINLFANYSIITLFRQDKGPELYPFAVGISLCGW